jgi:hypothetical protein
VVVDDFDVVCVTLSPLKTDSPLIVDPNANLAHDRNVGVPGRLSLADRHDGDRTIPPQTQITWPVT